LLDEVAPGAGGFGLGEVGGEVEGTADERPAAGANRADGDGGGHVRLADAGRTDEEDAGVRVDEARARQFDELRLRQFRIERPVEVGDGLDGDDAGLLQPTRKQAVRSAGQLVLDE
jgi:hypothetical protein